MNVAWIDCCEWDSGLLSDCKLSSGLGSSHGSLSLLNIHVRLGAWRRELHKCFFGSRHHVIDLETHWQANRILATFLSPLRFVVTGHSLGSIHHWLSDGEVGLMAANYLLGRSNWMQLKGQKRGFIWNALPERPNSRLGFLLEKCSRVLELFQSCDRRDAQENSGITSSPLTEILPIHFIHLLRG